MKTRTILGISALLFSFMCMAVLGFTRSESVPYQKNQTFNTSFSSLVTKPTATPVPRRTNPSDPTPAPSATPTPKDPSDPTPTPLKTPTPPNPSDPSPTPPATPMPKYSSDPTS